MFTTLILLPFFVACSLLGAVEAFNTANSANSHSNEDSTQDSITLSPQDYNPDIPSSTKWNSTAFITLVMAVTFPNIFTCVAVMMALKTLKNFNAKADDSRKSETFNSSIMETEFKIHAEQESMNTMAALQNPEVPLMEHHEAEDNKKENVTDAQVGDSSALAEQDLQAKASALQKEIKSLEEKIDSLANEHNHTMASLEAENALFENAVQTWKEGCERFRDEEAALKLSIEKLREERNSKMTALDSRETELENGVRKLEKDKKRFQLRVNEFDCDDILLQDKIRRFKEERGLALAEIEAREKYRVWDRETFWDELEKWQKEKLLLEAAKAFEFGERERDLKDREHALTRRELAVAAKETTSAVWSADSLAQQNPAAAEKTTEATSTTGDSSSKSGCESGLEAGDSLLGTSAPAVLESSPAVVET